MFTVMKRKYLSELVRGERGRVAVLRCEGAIRHRFADLGIIPGAVIECIGVSPMGDPRAYLIRGKTVAIRNSGARGIVVEADFLPEK